MVLLQMAEFYSNRVEEVMFAISLFITVLFYAEYKKYEQQIEKEEMLENLLKDQ